MNKKVLMVLALLAIAGAVFAQAPTLDKLRFSPTGSIASVSQANNQVSGAVVIPATHDGRTVTTIANSAFSGNRNITSITIPNSVTIIRGHAFSNCSGITSITIPNSVIELEFDAFQGNVGFSSLTIPASVQKAVRGIDNNSNVTSVTFLGNSIADYTNGGDLMNKYKAGGAGTYTRQRGNGVWTKQGGATVTCPTCNGTGVVSR